MPRTNTTMYEIIKSELVKSGLNQHFNNNQLTFFNDEYSFLKKIMRYDQDIEEIVNKKIFINCALNGTENDRHFKRYFLNEFMHKQLNRQTVESFASVIISTFMQNEYYLNTLYQNYEKILLGTKESNTNTVSKNRNANQDLPQDMVNIDLNDDTMLFANNNAISKDSNTSNSTDNSFNPEITLKGRVMLKVVMDSFQKKCFLNVF